MITKDIAVALKHGQTLYHMKITMANCKTPARCRVSGKCQTWKTRPNEFKLPVKHGLRDCFYITEHNAADWTTSEEEARTHILYLAGKVGGVRRNADGSLTTLVDNGDGSVGTLTTNVPDPGPLVHDKATGVISSGVAE